MHVYREEQRAVKLFWHLPLLENRRELPALGPAFLQHLGAVSSMVVSTLLAELR